MAPKIRHMFTVLCEYHMKDASGRHAFCGTFVNTEYTDFPTMSQEMVVAIGFVGETEEPLLVAIANSANEFIAVSELQKKRVGREGIIKPEAAVILHTVVATIPPIELKEPGIYKILFLEGEYLIHELPFGVLLMENSVSEDDEDADADS